MSGVAACTLNGSLPCLATYPPKARVIAASQRPCLCCICVCIVLLLERGTDANTLPKRGKMVSSTETLRVLNYNEEVIVLGADDVCSFVL